MGLNLTTKLEAALENQNLVRLTRKFGKGHFTGYVVAVSKSHLLLSLIGNGIWFDGYECLRIKDLKKIKKDPYREFIEAALKKRKLRRLRTPHINMQSTQDILDSAGKLFPLVTIHREKFDPDVCQIGQVVSTNRTHLNLIEIRPDAIWEDASEMYALREITRVSFAGSYEKALFLVGGKPKK